MNGHDASTCKICQEQKERRKHIEVHTILTPDVIEYIRHIIREEIADAVLLFVGPSSKLRLLQRRFLDKDIIFTGAISEREIAGYLNCLDVAVLPHEKSLFQDLAFHIKLIEYTASKKIVVSTPLEEVKRLDFPNIIMADLREDYWLTALNKAKTMKWNSNWDSLVERYDWSNIVKEFSKAIESSLR